MKDFSKRDYLVAAGIITAVLAAWFFLMASLMKIIDPQVGIFMVVLIGGFIWYYLARNKKSDK